MAQPRAYTRKCGVVNVNWSEIVTTSELGGKACLFGTGGVSAPTPAIGQA